MANSIKYSEGSESLALNKGNWWIGTGDSNKGPTVESGYWNAINPPDGGYTVYLNKETNGPSIHSINNDENLISFTNKISGQNYTTVSECLVYYQTQDDKLCVNREYENIVTDGLVLNLDAGYAPSYPTSGTTWYDLSGNGNDGTLINGPIYSGGSIVFDGVDDYATINNINNMLSPGIGNFTLSVWYNNLEDNRYHHLFNVLNQSNFAWKANNNQTGGVYFYGGNSYRSNVGDFGDWNLDFGIWNMHCLVRDGLTFTGYKNGNLVGTHSELFVKDITGSSIVLSSNGTTTGERAAHKRTLQMMYNRALTEQEILQNYNAQKGRFGL